MPIFLKLSKCRISLTQTAYFENIQYGKIYFHYGLVCTKTSYNYSAFFFLKGIFISNFYFSKMPIFLKLSNCRISLTQTAYFENIQCGKI